LSSRTEEGKAEGLKVSYSKESDFTYILAAMGGGMEPDMKKKLFILLALISLLSLGSCGVSEKKDDDKTGASELEENVAAPETSATPEPEAEKDNAPEIITEYIFNSGSSSIQGDRIYFSNTNDGGTLYSMKTDGSDLRKLNEEWIQWFYLSDGMIYYQDGSGLIYSMKTDGSSQQRLSDDASGAIHVLDGKIYYSNRNDDYKLYSMNIDGSDRKKLSDDNPLYMNVVGDQIYYSGELNGSDAKGIYRIKTDGSEKTKLSDDLPFDMLVVDDWIYFNNQRDEYKLYAMRTDGSDRHKLIDDYALKMSIVGDRIYYVKGDEWKVYSVKTDGSDRRLISDDHAEWLAIKDDLIYYTISGSKIYSMKTDGSDKQLIADLVSADNRSVTYEISASLHENMPEYRFVATGLTTGTDSWLIGYVMGLEVYDENNMLILSEDFSEYDQDMITGYPVYNEMMDTMGLHVVDVNFDGYKDVIILNTFAGAHGNTWYDCWLWDTKTSSFVTAPSFAEICNPALDREKKCIYSAGGSGAAYWGGSIYQFIDGEFVKTNELDTYGDGLTETKLVNGKMELVREVQFGSDEKLLAKEQEYYKNHELWQLEHPRWYWVGGHDADQWLE
jgi:hypothetical protein